ncbi:hypothetical protein [Paenirhodobacter sp.]|uniref:hypothetical protein n=1 Tax=Paenirhodobacter sp. TaxID=1965326 RepID=UPI003B514F2E
MEWRLELPTKGLDITTHPLNEQAWNALSVPKARSAPRAAIQDEMTGYDEAAR